jgi:hypothetical protein
LLFWINPGLIGWATIPGLAFWTYHG